MEEIWRDIAGYKGLYQVSNLGNVKSLNYNRTGKERVLKPKTNRNGYLQVVLSKDNKQKFFYVHRLVALHFIPNTNNLPEVNHIDENKSNNCVTNLEWCSSKYNNTYNDRQKRIGEKKSIPVVQLDLATNKAVNVYPSAHEAERLGGFSSSNITSCCKNKFHREGNNIYKGCKWMYLHEYISNIHPNIKTINLMGKTYEVNER